MGFDENSPGVSLIIYEVNLKINQDCVIEFKSWLYGHIREMLNFPGFINAELFQNEEQSSAQSIELVVKYSVDSFDSLNHYFAYNAATMREKGLMRFPDQFSASRRVLRTLSV